MKPLQLLLIALGIGFVGAIFLLINISSYNNNTVATENDINTILDKIKKDDNSEPLFEESITKIRTSPDILPEKYPHQKSSLLKEEKDSNTHNEEFDNTTPPENYSGNGDNDYSQMSSDENE